MKHVVAAKYRIIASGLKLNPKIVMDLDNLPEKEDGSMEPVQVATAEEAAEEVSNMVEIWHGRKTLTVKKTGSGLEITTPWSETRESDYDDVPAGLDEEDPLYPDEKLVIRVDGDHSLLEALEKLLTTKN